MTVRERQTVTEALELERAGMAWKAAGWVLLIFDCLLVVFIWTSLRSGSLFWLIWVLAEAFLGLLLIRIGISKRERSMRRAGRPAA